MGGKWNRWKTPTREVFNGKTRSTRTFQNWSGMLQRVKSDPYYIGVSISDMFYDYDLFYEWATKQKGFLEVDDNGKLYHLDKDIVGNGKIYSEDVCVFVPNEINNMVKSSGVSNLPIGVNYADRSGKHFTATCGYLGCVFQLGTRNNVEHAHGLYLQFRKLVVEDIMSRYGDKIDSRVYDSLLETCDYRNYDYSLYDSTI